MRHGKGSPKLPKQRVQKQFAAAPSQTPLATPGRLCLEMIVWHSHASEYLRRFVRRDLDPEPTARKEIVRRRV
jgi:hypothetical protein